MGGAGGWHEAAALASEMSRRVVIADVGPLIALVRVDALVLLKQLFGQVFITSIVRDEILPTSAFPDGVVLAASLAEEGWISVLPAPEDTWRPLNPGVDAGEASTLRIACLWRELGDAVLVVMDDRAGRAEARSLGLDLIGTAAIIGLAKTEGLIPLARPLLERMSREGYFLGPTVIAAVLSSVGE
jgi:predicted nucleic acid-binding protein